MGPPGGPGTYVLSLATLRALDPTNFPQGYIANVAGYALVNDGGGGLFVYDATSVEADNDGTIIEPANSIGRWYRIFSGPANPKWFGVTGNGATNDQVAFASALASGLTSFYVPSGTYVLGSTGITIPDAVQDFIMDDGSKFTYTGTGTAVTIAPHTNIGGVFSLAVSRTTADWDPATGSGLDATSIGVKLVNSAGVRLTLRYVNNFNIGAQLFSDGIGVQFSHVTIVDLVDNKVGLQLKKTGGGYVNQNYFYGGTISISGGHTVRLAGSRFIDLINGNTNTFIGQSLQSDMAQYSLYVNDNVNMFIGQRYEANQVGAILFTASAAYNGIIGGLFDAGTWEIINDLGAGNYYYGGFGVSVDANIANLKPFALRNGSTGRTFFSVARTASGGRTVIGNDTDLNGLLAYGGIFTPFKTPASAVAAGEANQIAWDTNYIYICTATNTWKRAAIATW